MTLSARFVFLVGFIIPAISSAAATGSVGIGLSVEGHDVVIQMLVPGFPAAQSGMLRVGDRIVGVWETPNTLVDVHNLPSIKSVADLIRGEPESTVTLRVVSSGESADRFRDVSLVRRKIDDRRADRSRLMKPTFPDLAYADKSPDEKLDLYLPRTADRPSPLVIWIHGGAFVFGDKSQMPSPDLGDSDSPRSLHGFYQYQVPDVVSLIAKGYAVVSLNYRLGMSQGAEALPAAQDGKAAVRFLRANATKYHLDPRRFAVWGDSAGGYIAAILGTTGDQATIFDDPTLGNAGVSSAVQAVVIWFGADDPRPDLSIAHYLVRAKTLPPFDIAHGDNDQSVPVIRAKRLQEALIKAGAKSMLTIVHGAAHSDPAFMRTQMLPTFAFLDRTVGR